MRYLLAAFTVAAALSISAASAFALCTCWADGGRGYKGCFPDTSACLDVGGYCDGGDCSLSHKKCINGKVCGTSCIPLDQSCTKPIGPHAQG
jgi:hypothetical protein